MQRNCLSLSSSPTGAACQRRIFLTAEAKGALDEAIAALPEKLRVVFLLRDIEGFSIQETGEALELTETAVKTRLLRARLQLRERLSVYFMDKLGMEKVK